MDPTPNIRNPPISIKQEYLPIVKSIYANRDRKRAERTAEFMAAVKKLSPAAKAHIGHIFRREQIHYDFMQVVFARGYKLKYGRALPESVPKHDFTKDDLFAFILAAHYDVFNGKGGEDSLVEEESDQAFKDESSQLVKLELDRHYLHEPHHPEYEKLTGRECREQDLLEMAIDRLARNVQFNKGDVDMDRMNKFLPTFTLGDTAKKVEIFKGFVALCKDMVSETAKEMYFRK